MRAIFFITVRSIEEFIDFLQNKLYLYKGLWKSFPVFYDIKLFSFYKNFCIWKQKYTSTLARSVPRFTLNKKINKNINNFSHLKT